jgi:hypothetical protein
MLYGDQSGKTKENTEKSLRLAALLFHDGTWVYKEPNIYIAESRLVYETGRTFSLGSREPKTR